MSVSEQGRSEQAQAALDELPMLKLMPEDVRRLVVDSFFPVIFSFGSSIVQEGEEADAFYVIVSGSARVLKKSEDGEEVSLNTIEGGRRIRRARACSRTPPAAPPCARAARSRSCGWTGRCSRRSRSSIPRCGTTSSATSAATICATSFASTRRSRACPADTLELLIAALEPVGAARGRGRGPPGRGAGADVIVKEGRLRVFHEEDGERSDLAYLRKGDFFGERSLLQGDRPDHSVEAVSDCELLR